MRIGTSDKTFTVEEYVRHELIAPRRSEFINGQLFEMPGEKDINNEIAGILYIMLSMLLKKEGYYVYNHDVKVKISGENKYYYPDVFVTNEVKTESNQYIKSEPVIIVEVVSESSQVTDYVDKYIDYTKIPCLQYYLIVEPETLLITCYRRNERSEWVTSKYTRPEDEIKLDTLGVSFKLKQVYQ
jgi:Uma2 family endonuclease